MIKKCRKEIVCRALLLAIAIALSVQLSFAQTSAPPSDRKDSPLTQQNPSAQDSTTETPVVSPQATSEATPLAANDHLPFMKSDDAAAEAPGTGGLLVRTFGALLLIVGLILGSAWGLKRFAGNRFASKSDDAPHLSVLSTVSLGDRRSLSVVRFGERTLLLGSTQQSISLLCSEAPAESVPMPARSVAELLKDNNFDHQLNVAEQLLSGAAGSGAWRDEATEV